MAKCLFSNHLTFEFASGLSRQTVIPDTPAITIKTYPVPRLDASFYYSHSYGKFFAFEMGMSYGFFVLGQKVTTNLDFSSDTIARFTSFQIHRQFQFPLRMIFRIPISNLCILTVSPGLSLAKLPDRTVIFPLVSENGNFGTFWYKTNDFYSMSSTFDLGIGIMKFIKNKDFLRISVTAKIMSGENWIAYSQWVLVGQRQGGSNHLYGGEYIFPGNFLTFNIGYSFSRTKRSFPSALRQ